MKRDRINRSRVAALAFATVALLPAALVSADDASDSASRIQRGFDISPVPASQLNLSKRNRALVGSAATS